MSLDDVLRIRCEPELRRRFQAIADRRHTKEATLARDLLWSYVEAAEAEILHETAPPYGVPNSNAKASAKVAADAACADALLAAQKPKPAAPKVRYKTRKAPRRPSAG